MQAAVNRMVEGIVLAAEALAALVIAIAVLEAAWRMLRLLARREARPDTAKLAIRLHLARWLAVALEITLAADILRTVVAPSWDEIGQLAAIATLRTVLNLFLEREIAAAAAHPETAERAGTHHRPQA
ncbi:DUF1622 domain-containing protein [Pseudoroseomonas cervicalis]|uniref:DUF1622 domain-containing protein n=1 Tax=Pseudoroseomonas cervicalis ATCC 49957 TaxID=525371 RepID=D5RLC2_9PROT|nr:DUF1622 domain-containing protein [Pseudoroseomonas cervicalis]EFH11895.1 hypothetical protein HMPREF0731_1883 [Pseudoroseomonas cervicalis ATCC 49957]